MPSHEAAHMMALIRSGNIVNIGGRPVLVTSSSKLASRRTYSIQLALAFAAIYLVWGSTYLAIRYAVETIPPLVTAGIRHSIAGTVLLAWAWARGFRPTRAHWISGFVSGALFFLIGHGTLHWAEQYVGSGLAALLIATEPMFILVLAWSIGQQKISLLSALGLGLGVAGVAALTGVELSVKGSSVLALLAVLAGSFSWSAGVVISPKLKLPNDALGRTALPTLCGALDAAGDRRPHGRISRHTLGEHFHEINLGTRVSDCLWFDRGIHFVHVAAAEVSARAGGDAHVCEPSGSSVSRMAACFRAADHAGSSGIGGDPRSDRIDPQRRAES